MPATEMVHVRIDRRVKAKATKTLAQMGLSISDAVRVLLTRVAVEKALPFEVKVPNAATVDAMEEARQASEDANRRLADIESRLSRLDAEIGGIRAAAEQESAAEEARIKAAAEEDARRIVTSAEQEIAAAARSARRELKAYAADLAVSMAEKQIHVDAANDQNLVRSFADQLTSESSGKGRQ